MEVEAPAPPRRPKQRPFVTGCFTWAVAIIAAAILLAVIVGCISLLAAVLVLQPHAPFISVTEATLDTLRYDQLSGTLTEVNVPLKLEARNVYAHSGATFSRLECRVAFVGITLAPLRATEPFQVPASGAQRLPFTASVQGAKLGDAGRRAMQSAILDDVVVFGVAAEARTSWKFVFVTIHQWTRFQCELRFNWSSGAARRFYCSSKKKGFF